MGCCVGCLSKSKSLPDSNHRAPLRRKAQRSSIRNRRRWSSIPEAMQNNVSISVSLEGNISSIPSTVIGDSKMSEENRKDSSFINHAAIAWAEMRRQWVGDRSKVSHKAPREPIISWCTAYDDLLSISQRFPQPMPLSEMVDFLVDIWHEEGLYD